MIVSSVEKNMPTFIDLFAGAGGLSEGFIQAGFMPVLHIEVDRYCCFTLKTRTAYHYLKRENRINEYYKYLNGEITREDLYSLLPVEILDAVINDEISRPKIPQLFEHVYKRLEELKRDSVDILVGGPPCQAYSKSGISADKDRKKNDARRYFYTLYARFIAEFKPKLFIFENVPGIKSINNGIYYKNLKKYCRLLGYEIDDSILDASDYGVLQKRKRVIIVGWKKNLNLTYPVFAKIDNPWTVNDLLSDLPSLKAGDAIEVGQYAGNATEYLDRFGLRNGMNLLVQHITRPHNPKDLLIYQMAIKSWNENRVRLMNSDIPPEMRTQKNTKSFLDRFKVVSKDHLAHTMLAHIAKDGHYYIHPDINQIRSLSIREAARIQSFPDDYFFEGPRTSVFAQIGNAVPPLLSEAIAKTLKGALHE